MQQEIEAKFLDQNHEEIRERLRALGAKQEVPMKLVRRTVFDYPDRRLKKRGAWIRLREELDGRIELMLKTVKADVIGETFEQPVTVTSYEAAQQFLVAIGLEVKAEEESRRELWRHGTVEVMLDEWPWVKPYIEIEALNKNTVKEFSQKLGLHWPDAQFGSVTSVYQNEYGITREEFTALELTISFNIPVPEALKNFKKSRM